MHRSILPRSRVGPTTAILVLVSVSHALAAAGQEPVLVWSGEIAPDRVTESVNDLRDPGSEMRLFEPLIPHLFLEYWDEDAPHDMLGMEQRRIVFVEFDSTGAVQTDPVGPFVRSAASFAPTLSRQHCVFTDSECESPPGTDPRAQVFDLDRFRPSRHWRWEVTPRCRELLAGEPASIPTDPPRLRVSDFAEQPFVGPRAMHAVVRAKSGVHVLDLPSAEILLSYVPLPTDNAQPIYAGFATDANVVALAWGLGASDDKSHNTELLVLDCGSPGRAIQRSVTRLSGPETPQTVVKVSAGGKQLAVSTLDSGVIRIMPTSSPPDREAETPAIGSTIPGDIRVFAGWWTRFAALNGSTIRIYELTDAGVILTDEFTFAGVDLRRDCLGASPSGAHILVRNRSSQAFDLHTTRGLIMSDVSRGQLCSTPSGVDYFAEGAGFRPMGTTTSVRLYRLPR
jgi:hypothetical protein